MSKDGLDAFRTAGECEICGVYCPRREPHHYRTRGAGGPDIPENLVAVGPHDQPWKCRCHHDIHTGRIPKRCVVTAIALREGTSVGEIERIINVARSLR